MKKQSMILFLLIAVIVSSCQEEVTNVRSESDIYLGLLPFHGKFDGNFKIEAFAVGSNESSSFNDAKIEGYVKGELGNTINVGVIKFDDLELSPNPNNMYLRDYSSANMSLFGKNVSVRIGTETATFYLPPPIHFNNYDYNAKISKGSKIKWNVDEKNTLGVAVEILFIPDARYPQHSSQHKFILSDDVGEYVFKEQDFEGIPDNAEVRLSLTRGGATIVKTDEGKKIRIIGVSTNGGAKVVFDK